MNGTVTKLMARVHAIENLASLAADPMTSGSEHTEYVNDLVAEREALEAELTRLFTPLNQCDGCMAGLQLRSGLHIDTDGKALMLCQKSKYGITGESNET